jgi:hypothetical protein
MRTYLLSALLVGTAACIGNLTPSQRAQDAAIDFTTAARFGRMDIAIERVSKEDRERFAKQHAAWGTSIRIVDCDMLGLRITNKDHAEAVVSVSWHRVDESEMRITQIAQHWRDHRGAWLLDSEERTAGDVGLLGEAATIMRPTTGPAQFETITIR